MNKTRIGYAFAALALIAVLGFLIVMTRSVGFGANNEIVAALRQLKQIDAEWNVDVLRSKTGLNNSYDPVASPLPLIEALAVQLQNKSEVMGASAESSKRLQPLLAAYEKAMGQKIALIENFKSQNAILRNSSRFLPVAAADLIEAVRAGSTAPASKAQVEESLNTLLTNTMTYALTPETALKERIEAGSRELKQQVQGFPDDVRERADTLAAHVATILKQQQIGNRLLGELAALPVVNAIDALGDAHAQEHEKLLVSQQKYGQVLVAYSVLLLLLIAYIGWRLFKSYRLLNATHAALQKSNAELKESQVYMVQTEKMSALGQMVAGIAHEINTPLAYVKGTIDVLAEQLAPVKELAQRCQQFVSAMRLPAQERDNAAVKLQLLGVETVSRNLIEAGVLEDMNTLLKDGVHGIDQISEIVLNLKNFSRLDRARVTEFSLQEGLNSTLLLARNLLKNTVEIRQEHLDVPKIQCSPSQINQVFLNIISNAAQAMADRAEKGVITLRTMREGDEMVRVEIQDNGSGIPKDVLPRIFDPFFTTKPIGKGTGMGLSISYKIIQQHGGMILVDSEQGVGTVFSILLPIRALEQSAVESDDLLLVA
ncbi:DAHL domain-containing protein [Polaromonas sp.]|uniref:DAHL domain-containing protein n=1 Tax=Polaromonas sp. TaxID=1869339 RepID=UPI0025FC5ED4|nr:DAHL domain-containing protein [Polaromonas sp.]